MIPFSPAEVEWLVTVQHRIKQGARNPEAAREFMRGLSLDQAALVGRWMGYMGQGRKQAEEAIRAIGTARKQKKRGKEFLQRQRKASHDQEQHQQQQT